MKTERGFYLLITLNRNKISNKSPGNQKTKERRAQEAHQTFLSSNQNQKIITQYSNHLKNQNFGKTSQMFRGLSKNYSPKTDKRIIHAKQKKEKKIDNKPRNLSNLKKKRIKKKIKTYTLFRLKETKPMSQTFFRTQRINQK